MISVHLSIAFFRVFVLMNDIVLYTNSIMIYPRLVQNPFFVNMRETNRGQTEEKEKKKKIKRKRVENGKWKQKKEGIREERKEEGVTKKNYGEGRETIREVKNQRKKKWRRKRKSK